MPRRMRITHRSLPVGRWSTRYATEAMDKAERHINLICMLLAARRPRTLDEIRAVYPDAPEPGVGDGIEPDVDTDEPGEASEDSLAEATFRRMFERDKEELRGLGFRIDLVPMGAWSEGYAIGREETLVPDLALTAAEHAALMLAAQAWGDATLGPASARTAAIKLSSASRGGEGGAFAASEPWLVPVVAPPSSHAGPLMDAMHRRKVAHFSYRAQGTGQIAMRTLEPHSVVFRGAWYVKGFDRDRGEMRSFKLDRIESEVKVAAGDAPDFDPPAASSGPPAAQDGAEDARATIAVDPAFAWWVGQRAGAAAGAPMADGRIPITLPVADEDRLVAWVAGLGSTAELLETETLRERIVDHLRALVDGV